METCTTITIRQENKEDQAAISQLLNMAYDHLDERAMVNSSRNSPAFIPALSQVAVLEDKIVGQIFFATIKIFNSEQQEMPSLRLVSLSVLKEFQNQGTEQRLVKEGLQKATALRYEAVLVFGQEDFYDQFGFRPVNKWRLDSPINVPVKHLMMALELVPQSLQNISEIFEYAPEFKFPYPKLTHSFTIETERLLLKPLTYDQLVKYVRCDNSLEAELNLNKSLRSISHDLKAAFEETIFPNVADKTKNYLFSTIWTAISKLENKMVGDICMYGEPDDKGVVEIGYGVYNESRNNGFMTEIVSAMILWIAKQPTVNSVIASTEKSNTPSFRVLEKNGFIKTGEKDSLFHWKLSMNKIH